MNILFYSSILLFNPVIRLANKVRWRFGRPYLCGNAYLDDFLPLVQPGMIILTHKDFEFTNLFINGYWTHTAIVTSGELVVEAVSKGVVTQPLRSFLSTVDDFLILKPTFCDTDAMRSASEHVKRFLGFPYNFTFCPEEDSVYCSELIFRAYSQIPEWETVAGLHEGHIHEFYEGNILLPHSFSESELLWQEVSPS